MTVCEIDLLYLLRLKRNIFRVINRHGKWRIIQKG
jgi:hypothetical protein